MKYVTKEKSTIKLMNLLSRRRTNLEAFIESQGITTYELLIERCSRMGVEPPDRHAFDKVSRRRETVSSPTEGIIVLETPETITESGLPVEELPTLLDPYPPTQKRKKRKGG